MAYDDKIYQIETHRLRLRPWKTKDYAEFARMNADPEVMRYFPKLLTRSESDEFTARLAGLIETKGWGFWVTELKKDGKFIGLVGLNLSEDLPLPSCVEVGWRLDRPFWGKGFATEAAEASLHFAFSILNEPRVAAFTATTNTPSMDVMSRLGMQDTEVNFLHPKVAESSGLKEHVHYEIFKTDFYAGFDESKVSISVSTDEQDERG